MNFTIMPKSVVIGILFVVLFSVQVTATQQESTEAHITGKLTALSESIDTLAKQIEKQTNSSKQDISLRKLDIAIAYLNFRSRRIEMFERDLQSSRTKRNRLEDLLEQFQREEDGLSPSFDANQQGSIQKAREELGFRRQSIKDRIERMDEEIILLENRMMDMQSQIDSVESYVQKNLEF